MGIEGSKCRRLLFATASVLALQLALPIAAPAETFEESLARVDHVLRTDPRHIVAHAKHSCMNRRDLAVQLHQAGQTARAERSLKYCFRLLEISDDKPLPVVVDKEEVASAAIAAARAEAADEVELSLTLAPDLENGLEIYRGCAECHMPEGWGLASGLVPQLAGQHRSVVIKQLADIRAGNRDNLLMLPYSSVKAIGGPQAVADVAGYIDTLEISIATGKGSGEDLELGERLYAENCASCHGPEGEGDNERYMPRIQSQHYNYLVHQFGQIRDGKRRNADPAMVELIKEIDEREMRAILDYVSRLEPPEMFQAPPDWRNPDFADRGPDDSVTQ